MPPKKQKQTPKNAFFYFMMEFKDTQGRNFINMQEAADQAGQHWSKMSKAQRKPYEEKALYEKNNLKPGKYTSDGLDINMVENLEKQKNQKNEEMKNNINEELKIAFRDGNIQEKMLYIIHINCFCYCSSESRHYPAEIAIAGFNLVDGVQPENVYHAMIKPGVLPLGYACEALKLSNESHQIPPPMSDEMENNIKEVYFAIKQFLQKRMRGSQRMPIVYCHETQLNMVQEVLNNWSEVYDGQILFNVYNLQYMFRVLKNTVAGNNVWPSDSFSFREIEKDVNAFAKGIACAYHEQSNVPVHCSRSVVIRYGYTICDNCCPDLHIPLMPGFHVPQMALVSPSRPSSAASDVSSKSSRSSRSKAYSSSFRDDDTDSVISLSNKSDWDSQSVASDVSTINDDADYPALGKSKRKNMSYDRSWSFTPNDSSSVCSQSSTRSYAGATGTAGLSRRLTDLPSSVVDGMDNLSLGSNVSIFSLGRGVAKDFTSAENFPALDKGRGVRQKGRNVARPNSSKN